MQQTIFTTCWLPSEQHVKKTTTKLTEWLRGQSFNQTTPIKSWMLHNRIQVGHLTYSCISLCLCGLLNYFFQQTVLIAFTSFIYNSYFSCVFKRANMICIKQHPIRNHVQMPNTILTNKTNMKRQVTQIERNKLVANTSC